MFNQYIKMTNKVFQHIDTNYQNQQTYMKKLETQIGQISLQLAELFFDRSLQLVERYQRKLLGNTMINPKEQVKDVTTRGGVQLPGIHAKRPKRKDEVVEVDKANKDAKSTLITENEEQRKALTVRALNLIKTYVPLISFPQRLQKKLDKQFAKFVEVSKKLHINIHFADILAQMPNHDKFLKEILPNKRKLEEHETICTNEECYVILLKKLPPKLKDQTQRV